MSDNTAHIEVKAGSERSFGLVFAAVFAIVALLPLWNGGAVRWWALVIAAGFLLAGLVLPKVLAVPNRLWFKFGLLLGMVIAPLVMMILYYLTVTPTGIIMRLLGKDLLRQKIDKQAASYWILRDGPASSMKDQF